MGDVASLDVAGMVTCAVVGGSLGFGAGDGGAWVAVWIGGCAGYVVGGYVVAGDVGADVGGVVEGADGDAGNVVYDAARGVAVVGEVAVDAGVDVVAVEKGDGVGDDAGIGGAEDQYCAQ